MIYTGSIIPARGGQVLHQEVCHCPDCAEWHFECRRCGNGIEYFWAQCPHDRPENRLTLTVAGTGGRTYRLLHARESSVRPAH